MVFRIVLMAVTLLLAENIGVRYDSHRREFFIRTMKKRIILHQTIPS